MIVKEFPYLQKLKKLYVFNSGCQSKQKLLTPLTMSNILNFVVYSDEVNPNRFTKSEVEKQQLKQLKKAYFRKHKIVNHKLNLTNKQISNRFATKTTITL